MSRDALRRQRRRELDARRSKSRVRLGGCLQSWGQLKDRLGFALHSELAQYLLESYLSKVCAKCSGSMGEEEGAVAIVTSAELLQRLVLLVHCHGQQCPFPPTLRPSSTDETICGGPVGDEQSARGRRALRSCRKAGRGKLNAQRSAGCEEDGHVSFLGREREQPREGLKPGVVLKYSCEGGHVISWCPSEKGTKEAETGRGNDITKGAGTPGGSSRSREPESGEGNETRSSAQTEEAPSAVETNRTNSGGIQETRERGDQLGEAEVTIDFRTTETEQSERGVPYTQVSESAMGPAESVEMQETCSRKTSESDDKEVDSAKYTNCNYILENESTAIPRRAMRGRQKTVSHLSAGRVNLIPVVRDNRRRAKGMRDDDISQIAGKRKRKATPRDILLCEVDGCGKIFSSRQYLNHHMKYQHFQQKTFSCSHPTCGKSFNFKKHLKEHEKLHSNQRDYICEFCARAFRTSSNLIIHRRIHTGEKPLQCEVCGFTCRQKASLNWHMRKHDAESGYQFPCEICGRRFEKRDNVTAHRSKSHPGQTPGAAQSTDHVALGRDLAPASRTAKDKGSSNPATDGDGYCIVVV